ncbi:MAG: hypothetical protein NTW49_15065, partial [Bacteroidia bacterium]|nr:hypothetical protein [Bacteroidia bacterium]
MPGNKSANIFRMLLSVRLLLALPLFFIFPTLNTFGQQRKAPPNPKNIIIMIGDGVGYNHILATDYYLGMVAQVQEKFPVRLAMSHYPVKAGEYEAGNPGSNYYAAGYNPSIAW